MDKLSRLDRPSQFGKTQEERLFNVGLELSITWINRILFLKLLEAQLISYHEGDKSYAFLNYQRISSYESEEHTSELQSRPHLVCRLLLEKKKKIKRNDI